VALAETAAETAALLEVGLKPRLRQRAGAGAAAHEGE